jgi:hypothetical protein
MMRAASIVVVVLAIVSATGNAWADDLSLALKTQRSAAGDLEALDTQHAVSNDIALLRAWLDDATRRQQAGDDTRARETFDRCLAQADYIRQRLAANKKIAEAERKTRDMQLARDKVQTTKKALADAQARKKTLEGGR